MTLLVVVAVVAVMPLVVLAARFALRSPMAGVVAYATIVPFGSAIDLPLPLPPPFDTLSSLAGLVAIGGMVVHLAVTRRSAQGLHPPVAPWLVFIGVCALSYSWSIAPRTTADELFLVASGFGLYVLVSLMPVTREQLARVTTGVISGATLASLLALLLLVTGRTPVGESGTPRFVITGDDPNHTAAALILPLVLAVSRGLASNRSLSQRVANLAAGALMTLGIVLTGSRGGLVSALIALLFLGLHGGSPRRVAALSASVVVFAVGALALAPQSVETRLTSTSSTGRTDIWRLGLDACAEHCAAGSGWGTFPDVYQEEYITNPSAGGFRDERYRAHNIWLQAAVETGIAGLVLLLAAVGMLLREAQRLPGAERAACTAALLGLIVASSLVSNLIFKYFWLVPTYVAIAASATRPVARGARTAALRHPGTLVGLTSGSG